ncbi:SagB family peptide dehydrogenase [Methylocystis sp. IM3]|uniref:SagB/ThcOx family dehydrogenase n=1 Tax=unclassified Methylocystis TaxID=2625913 RepID=UPI0030F53DDA
MSENSRAAPARLFARLNPGVSLKEGAGGVLSALFDGQTLLLGRFSATALRGADALATGLPLSSAREGEAPEEKELRALVERLALHGLVEYRLARAPDGPDLVTIEPQMRDYRPNIEKLHEMRRYILSRFATLRRRGEDMVLESPLSGAAIRLGDGGAIGAVARLSKPTSLAELSADSGFPGEAFLGLLVDCKMAFTPDPGKGLRASEGDEALALWEVHDLLFHVRSTNGRHANPTGGLYAQAHLAPQPPAVRPAWPGPAIDLDRFAATADSDVAALLRRRHSDRVFDDAHPITLAEVARFLDGAARICARRTFRDDHGGETEIAARPYPSGGASYELEFYLAVDRCDGLPRGFYHYDADRHALVAIGATERQVGAMIDDGQFAMGAPRPPQIMITLAARFGRVSWKYSGFAYSLVLKHVGVVMQTLYLMATDMELGACAIGAGDIDLFARMTGLPFHVEGAVGQMAIGRAAADSRDHEG